MKISIILGTRPEIIKMAPIARECIRRNVKFFILHTNQHYSFEMDKIFFKELNLPYPKYNLKIGSGTHSEQTGKMLVGIERILLKEKPNIVLVEGDTNTVLAGALAAKKINIKIGHIEAGLRSYYEKMPEEINRVLVDHISDFLFAPTDEAKKNLLKEGIYPGKIYVVGNTIVDSIYQNIKIAEKKSKILKYLNLKPNCYFLLTLHRQENVDEKERFKSILKGADLIFKKLKYPIIWPIHPRSLKTMKKFKLKLPLGIKIINPLGFSDFILLEKNAKLILTDSGGVQEEACILGVPCVTLRDNTERPETLKVKANVLSGVSPPKILKLVFLMLNKKNKKWSNPFGDGRSSTRILNILAKELK